MNRSVPLLALLVALLLAGCGESAAPRAWAPADGPIRVVVTTMQLADFVQQIAGDTVSIEVLMKEGINHHTYEPSVRDIKLLAEAHLVVINGVGLDSWIKPLLANSGSTAPLIESSTGIKTLDLYHPDHVHPNGDPHIWHDTRNAKQMVLNVAAGLGQFAPEYRERYDAAAAAYGGQLDQLATEIQTILAPIPPERRAFVTSHEAFGYFAKQFDLKLVGTITIASDSTEPSQQQILALVEKIKDQQAIAIFTETTIDPRLAEQIAAEANVKLVPNLYSDSLSAPGGDADTYLAMMRHNARVIADGLR